MFTMLQLPRISNAAPLRGLSDQPDPPQVGVWMSAGHITASTQLDRFFGWRTIFVRRLEASESELLALDIRPFKLRLARSHPDAVRCAPADGASPLTREQ